jgi:elongation factor P hydroxylase
MEEVFTTQTFMYTFCLGMVIGGDEPIPIPIDEVANLKLFQFKK